MPSSFLRTRKDRHTKPAATPGVYTPNEEANDKPPVSSAPKLPHENDESRRSQGSDSQRPDMNQAYKDIQSGQVDTDLRGTGGQDEQNKRGGARSDEAPPKTTDQQKRNG